MQLGDEDLTDDQIRDTFHYRWPRFCVDPFFWGAPKKAAFSFVREWKEIKFEKKSNSKLNDIKGKPGIYMFIAKPNDMATLDHSYILYVGETVDLARRFAEYFRYAGTNHPSDQLKRRMVVVWADYLYFHYVVTPEHWTTAARVEAEYDLIDSIAPPINDEFRSKVLEARAKQLRF